MAERDQGRWDGRYLGRSAPDPAEVGLPAVFVPFEGEFPTCGRALDLACGSGEFSVWLARRGVDVVGVDISPTAIAQARELAAASGVSDRSRFEVVDLDTGLPAGPPADVIVCHLFRDPRLYTPIIERLAPGGLLAIAVLSVVGAAPGRFRAAPGELTTAFGELQVIASGEGDGLAWLLGRRPGS
ncbi:class I SAM-dependent methyltransferase [Mycolicibacterium hassiacum]|uniref:class I SAM-dependent methyltransferase n=1 Tax=Mycolicibacterium hassiacum TaxID=46351 RepID=UPI00047571EE|nr:methyltransferase domain-containing protein [Mycolicibacterium hassiacum]